MAKVARKAKFVPQVRTLAHVIDDLAALKPKMSEMEKACKKLEQELGDFLGDDLKRDGVYQGDLYQMILKRADPAPLYLDNEKVLALIGSKAFEACKTPRETVRKTFIKKEH